MKRERFSTDITRIQFDSMEEWLVNRKGIGGSDASAILGLNPYKTNQELWMEKKGQMYPVDISDKPYVKYGNDAEPLLRALFSLDYPEYTVEYYDNNIENRSVNQLPLQKHMQVKKWLSNRQKQITNQTSKK